MPHKRSNHGQSIHLHLNDFRRHFALHLHVDTSNCVHGYIHHGYDFRHMLTKG